MATSKPSLKNISNLHPNTQHNLGYFGSNSDIMNALHCGDSKIIKYSSLKQYRSLLDLLPETFDFRIILLESERNSGHWVSIIRMGTTIELFNSYGVEIDKEFRFIPDYIERMLGESRHYLSELVDSVPPEFQVISNKIDFQSHDDKVATCSRWNILRIRSASMGEDLANFQRNVMNLKKVWKVPYDIIVLSLVQFPTDL